MTTPLLFRGAEDRMSDTSRAVFADDEVEGTPRKKEAIKRQLEDIDIAKMEAEAEKQVKLKEAIPFFDALFPDAPFGSDPTEQQQNLMSDLMEALESLPEGTPFSEAIKNPEFSQAISAIENPELSKAIAEVARKIMGR